MARLNRLPPADGERVPAPLIALERALEDVYRQVRRTDATVQAVKRHLDALNDGMQMLATFDAELTDDAIEAVRRVDDVARHQLAQLEDGKRLPAELVEPVATLREQLQSTRPWRDVAFVEAHAEQIRQAYVQARASILQELGEEEEQIRARVKSRAGFATLSADKSHHVLRPIADAIPATSDDAIAPTLRSLRGDAEQALLHAEEEANQRLDQILSEQSQTPVRPVSLDLRHREIATREELNEVLDDLRRRIEAELDRGHRVRLI